IQLLKSGATGSLFRVARLRILRFSPRESSVYFRFSLTVLSGLHSLSVGQWWRIIGSFTEVTIVFFDFFSVRGFFQQNRRFGFFFNQKLA
ncbi:hypothetical protein, partial [Xenorhabdus santafensis]|uniref:hypothetical protein n=1 Tax=Xenorhabdus santafensis TaxID=2582833 RepID=UPI0029E7E1E1